MSECSDEQPAPKEATVVRELERLHCVGVRIPADGSELFCDGKLVKISPRDQKHPRIHEGVYGFVSGVIPGASVRFHIERDETTDRVDGDRPPPHWNTSPVEKIELMSDGSYRITTTGDFMPGTYILTGTHTRERKVVNDLAPEEEVIPDIEQPRQRTARNLWGLLGRGRKS